MFLLFNLQRYFFTTFQLSDYLFILSVFTLPPSIIFPSIRLILRETYWFGVWSEILLSGECNSAWALNDWFKSSCLPRLYSKDNKYFINRSAVRIHQLRFEDKDADNLALTRKNEWHQSLGSAAVFLVNGITIPRWRDISCKMFVRKWMPSGVHDAIKWLTISSHQEL